MRDLAGWTLSDAATLTVNIPAAPRLSNVLRDANGACGIGFTGASGFAYSIAASTNLSDWFTIRAGLVGTNGLFWFEDTASQSLPACFYRVVWP